jgi:hypothetical protein
VPTVVFNEKVSLVGAVPVEQQYRPLIDWMLAGEPRGLIPSTSATESSIVRPHAP